MNILIKLTCLIGLVVAPILGGHSASTVSACCSGQGTEVVCKSMSHEECVAKGCTNPNCEFAEGHKHSASCNHGKVVKEIKDVKIEKTKSDDGKVTAKVVLTTLVNGEEVVEEKFFEGDDLEVEAKIAELGL
jgi:K(+)-stimulated pyrophosphate-energized sodium pump